MRDEVRALAPWMNKTDRLQKPSCRKNLQGLGTARVQGTEQKEQQELQAGRRVMTESSRRNGKGKPQGAQGQGFSMTHPWTHSCSRSDRMENISDHPSVLQPQHNRPVPSFAIKGWSCLKSQL